MTIERFLIPRRFPASCGFVFHNRTAWDHPSLTSRLGWDSVETTRHRAKWMIIECVQYSRIPDYSHTDTAVQAPCDRSGFFHSTESDTHDRGLQRQIKRFDTYANIEHRGNKTNHYKSDIHRLSEV